MPPRIMQLNAAVLGTANAAGGVIVELGPSSGKGPTTWHVDGVIIGNGRAGLAPIPRVQVYVDTVAASNLQGQSYDGSFAQGKCDITLVRGQKLIAVWTGGQAGDQCAFTVTGTKW